MTRLQRTFPALCLSAGLVLLSPIRAATPAATSRTAAPVETEWSLCKSILDGPTLYRSDDNPTIQRFRIIGRYHGQYYLLDSTQGGKDGWENRRVRVGAEVDLFRALTLSVNLNLHIEDEEGWFVENLEDFALLWNLSPRFRLALGKMKAPITQEWRTSSNHLLTLERSRIVTVVVPEKMGGVLAVFEQADWIAELGAYSNRTDPDSGHPTFDGGHSIFGSIAHKPHTLGLIRADYLYSNLDGADNATRGFEHVVSATYETRWAAFQLAVNIVGGFGGNAAGDVYGIVVMPTCDLTDRLQAVMRYQYSTSTDIAGLSLSSRYEATADDLESRRGDTSHTFYAGLNYYLCGHRLKLMTGIEYSRFNQDTGGTFEGWTWFNGIRFHL